MFCCLESTSKEVGGLNVAILVSWKTSSVKRCLYRFLNGISSSAVPTLSPAFKFDFFDQYTRLLRYLCNQVCYMLSRDLVGCQSWYVINSRIDCVNERLQFFYVGIRPFLLQMLVDDVFGRSNIALWKRRFGFTVCGVSVKAFAPQNFLQTPLNSVLLSDHTFNG